MLFFISVHPFLSLLTVSLPCFLASVLPLGVHIAANKHHVIINKCPLCFVFAEKQEKEVDIYASLSDEKAFVFSVALAEINRKILGQRLIL